MLDMERSLRNCVSQQESNWHLSLYVHLVVFDFWNGMHSDRVHLYPMASIHLHRYKFALSTLLKRVAYIVLAGPGGLVIYLPTFSKFSQLIWLAST